MKSCIFNKKLQNRENTEATKNKKTACGFFILSGLCAFSIKRKYVNVSNNRVEII